MEPNVVSLAGIHSNINKQHFISHNHMIMTQGNTRTYINDLTHNNNSGDSIASSGEKKR